MNDDTTPLPTTAPAPRRRTLLLVGVAAAVGLTALGITSAVAGSSGGNDVGLAAVSPAYGGPRGEGDAPATTPQEGDGAGGAAKSCDGGGPAPAPRPPGAEEAPRPPAAGDDATRPMPEDGPAAAKPKDGEAPKPPKAPKDGAARPTPPVAPDAER